MVVACTNQFGNMVRESQTGVHDHAKIPDVTRRLDFNPGDFHSSGLQRLDSLSGPQPDYFRFRGVQSETVTGHPFSYIVNTVGESFGENVCVTWQAVII